MMLSIIIINYNSFRFTSDCIRSIQEHKGALDCEIILVDNASVECDAIMFLEEFPSIKLVKSDKNGGFAYGNNLGLQYATGEYILLLNSDTILKENSLERSIEFIKARPSTGVMGCRMTFPDGKIQYTARRFRSISWELLDLFRFIPFMMSYPLRAKRMLGKYFHHDQDMECDWLNGAFFLFPRKILDEMPGNKLDDRFFMYGEDQLWCEQIKALGYKNQFYAGTTIIHINSGSTELKNQLALRKTMMNHELVIMKERKGRGAYYFFFSCIYVAKESTRNFIKGVLFRLTGKVLR